METAQKAKIPSRHIKLLLTDRCNAKCEYCHLEGQNKIVKAKERIDGEFVNKLLDNVECSRISISGGEPTINPNLEEICYSIREHGIWAILDTNGRKTETIKNILPYINEIRFNIDSLNPDTYLKLKKVDIDPLLKSVEIASERARKIENHLKVAFNTTILAENSDINSIGSLISFAKKNKATIRFIERFEKGQTQINPNARLVRDIVWQLLGADSTIYNGTYHISGGGARVEIFRSVCAAVIESIGLGRENDEISHAYSQDEIKERSASEYCHNYTKLYIAPSGDIKPCFLKEDTVPLYDALMSGDCEKARENIEKAILLLGNGPCKEQEVKQEKDYGLNLGAFDYNGVWG